MRTPLSRYTDEERARSPETAWRVDELLSLGLQGLKKWHLAMLRRDAPPVIVIGTLPAPWPGGVVSMLACGHKTSLAPTGQTRKCLFCLGVQKIASILTDKRNIAAMEVERDAKKAAKAVRIASLEHKARCEQKRKRKKAAKDGDREAETQGAPRVARLRGRDVPHMGPRRVLGGGRTHAQGAGVHGRERARTAVLRRDGAEARRPRLSRRRVRRARGRSSGDGRAAAQRGPAVGRRHHAREAAVIRVPGRRHRAHLAATAFICAADLSRRRHRRRPTHSLGWTRGHDDPELSW